MFQTILVAVALDHLQQLPRQIDAARKLLAPGGRILAVTVIEEMPPFVAEYITVHPDPQALSAETAKRLSDALADQPDVERRVLAGKPGLALANLAEEIGAELIIASAHRPGAEGYTLGSTTSRLTRRSPCSVLVLR